MFYGMLLLHFCPLLILLWEPICSSLKPKVQVQTKYLTPPILVLPRMKASKDECRTAHLYWFHQLHPLKQKLRFCHWRILTATSSFWIFLWTIFQILSSVNRSGGGSKLLTPVSGHSIKRTNLYLLDLCWQRSIHVFISTSWCKRCY